MKIKTIKDIPELEGKRVLTRVDFNVPINNGVITDDTRIQETLPTINYLRDRKCKIILMAHLGKANGKVDEKYRFDLVAQRLTKLLGLPVTKLDEIVTPHVKATIDSMNNGEIILLENTRFHPGEKSNDPEFAKQLAMLGDIYVNDAFGTAHRKHASTHGVAMLLPAYGGLLMQKEIEALAPPLNNPEAPLTMIVGGAKISTKIDIINNFIEKADHFLIGGAMANTFLAASGKNVGSSLYEEDQLQLAKEIMEKCAHAKDKFIIPNDVLVANEIKENTPTKTLTADQVEGDMKILDIGPKTAQKYSEIIQKSKTVIWNGPLGLYEIKPFHQGTEKVARALASHNCTSIIGGGDTADCLKKLQIPKDTFTHISTGGGAAIDFLSGKQLPGITPLLQATKQ